MKMLLTGGAGYIGSHTAVALLEAGHSVVTVDNYSNSSPKSLRRVAWICGKQLGSGTIGCAETNGVTLTTYQLDVADKEAMKRVLEMERPDCIIHFAGLKAVGESCERPVEYYRNNIDTTLTLLECMKETGISRIVFSSSATVYGDDNKPPFVETMPRGACTNPYGWTKWMQEQILTDAQKASAVACERATTGCELSVVLLRYFNPVGSHESGLIGEDPQGIPNNLMPYISQVAVGRRDHLTVFGNDYNTPDGTCRRDYIHVMDLAEGHVKAAEYALTHTGTEIFNLGTGKPYSVLDMIKAFGTACGHEIAYKVGPRRAGDVQDSWADAGKAKEILGWEAKRGIDEMCRDSWNWQNRNPGGYR